MPATQASDQIKAALEQQGVAIASVSCPQGVLIPPYAQANQPSEAGAADAATEDFGMAEVDGVASGGPEGGGMEGVTPSGIGEVSGTGGMEGVTPSGVGEVSGTSGMEGVTPSGVGEVSGTGGMEGVTSSDPAPATAAHDFTDAPPDGALAPEADAIAAAPPMMPTASLYRPFVCTGTLKDEVTFPILVSRRTEQGQLQWGVPNSKQLLNLEELKQEIAETLSKEVGAPVELDCGTGFRINRPGESFTCTALNNPVIQSNNQQLTLVEVRVTTGPDGKVSWQQVRQEALANAAGSMTDPSLTDPFSGTDSLTPAFNDAPFTDSTQTAPNPTP